MKHDYEVRAQKFIQKVFPYIKDATKPCEVRMEIFVFNYHHHRKVLVGNGLSRIALITSDYVVKWDYDEEQIALTGGCENEVKLYSIAEKEGYAHLFAKITPYEYGNRKFYIMPRVHGMDEESWDYADSFMTEEESEWCDDHQLTDLHSSNYGFYKGKVVIFDYACIRHQDTSTWT